MTKKSFLKKTKIKFAVFCKKVSCVHNYELCIMNYELKTAGGNFL